MNYVSCKDEQTKEIVPDNQAQPIFTCYLSKPLPTLGIPIVSKEMACNRHIYLEAANNKTYKNTDMERKKLTK